MAVITLQPADRETPISVSWERIEPGIFKVIVDTNTYSFALSWVNEGEGLAHNLETGEIHPFYVWCEDENIQLWLEGRIYGLTQGTPQARRQSGVKSLSPASGDVKAPMPGTVLKILVSPGDSVKANAPLLMMESMKMEMTLTAPAESTVSKISCEVGQLVKMNTVLVHLEATEDDSVVSQNR